MSELNAESVLASIVELRKSIAESNAELRASIAEQGKRMEQETAELRASIAEQGKRLDVVCERLDEQGKRMDEQGKRIDAVCKRLDEQGKRMEDQGKRMDKVLDELRVNNHRVGELTNKVGRIIEKVVVPGIVDKFNEKGFKFDAVSTNVEFLNEKKNGNLAEVDALLENGKFVIAVESKTELTVKDVNTHIKRLQALRKVPRFKGKKIYGAVSTAVAKEKPINYALEKGFYVLQQPDVMAVRIVDFPKGRSAKAW
jgi:septal ring factor EnvC (AmiA/AmiB activator)